MNKKEAIQEMLNGNKVTRKIWHRNRYMVFNNAEVFIGMTGDNQILDENINELGGADDWEIYIPEKKKVKKKVRAFIVCPPDGNLFKKVGSISLHEKSKYAEDNIHPLFYKDIKEIEFEIEVDEETHAHPQREERYEILRRKKR